MEKKNYVKIYLISRKDKVDYDEYDSFVVAAKNENEALEFARIQGGSYCGGNCFTKDNVVIKQLKRTCKKGIILGSFNAG